MIFQIGGTILYLQEHSLCILAKFYSFDCFIYVHDSFWTNFFIMMWDKDQRSCVCVCVCVCVCIWMSSFSSTICWKDYAFPTEILWHQCKNLTIYMWVYESISGLYSVPLICLSIFMPVLHCLNYCSFIINFEVKLKSF